MISIIDNINKLSSQNGNFMFLKVLTSFIVRFLSKI